MKLKTVEEVVMLSRKQWKSWMNNSNSGRKIKFWLDDYVNKLSQEDRNSLILKLCDRIYELDENIQED